jgi:hypothetical protein
MMKSCAVIGLCTLLCGAALASRSEATQINSYSFSNQGPYSASYSPYEAFDFFNVRGQFSGAADLSGFISLGDLTAFNVDALIEGTTPAGDTVLVHLGFADLSFFSFDTATLSSSLGFIAQGGSGLVCVGAPAALNPACEDPASPFGPATYFATDKGTGYFTANFADVTAVPVGVATPEPAGWVLLALGFAGLGLASRQFRLGGKAAA